MCEPEYNRNNPSKPKDEVNVIDSLYSEARNGDLEALETLKEMSKGGNEGAIEALGELAEEVNEDAIDTLIDIAKGENGSEFAIEALAEVIEAENINAPRVLIEKISKAENEYVLKALSKKIAEEGYEFAIEALADIAEDIDIDEDINTDTIKALVETAAENGDCIAQYLLACIYLNEGEIELAMSYCKKIIDGNSNFDVLYELGLRLEGEGYTNQAIELYKIAAENDDVHSYLRLAELYVECANNSKINLDTKEACKYFLLALCFSDLLDADSMAKLYEHYKNYNYVQDYVSEFYNAKSYNDIHIAIKNFTENNMEVKLDTPFFDSFEEGKQYNFDDSIDFGDDEEQSSNNNLEDDVENYKNDDEENPDPDSFEGFEIDEYSTADERGEDDENDDWEDDDVFL